MTFWIITIGIVLVSFAIAAVSGVFLVPFFHKIKFGQPIKIKDGPQWHAKKQGTPTMGGFMFILSTVIASIAGYWVYRLVENPDVTSAETKEKFIRLISVIGFSACFGLIGFIDDYTKVVRKDNDALSPIQKILLQVLFSLGFLFALYKYGGGSTSIDLGFWESPQLGIFYYIILIPIIIYLTNAVNLTDGIDGLCGSVTMIAMIIFTICCSYLDFKEISCFTLALAGGCIGFLVWNFNPAKCFMGDTGSMFLGAAVTGVALILHKHLLLVLVSMVYIIEALSVVIQVTYFKITKKKYGEGRRIFKMTPIHHHFELSKWSEYKIVITFSLTGLVFGLLGAGTLIWFG